MALEENDRHSRKVRPRRPLVSEDGPSGFDVTCTIGRVELGTGDLGPHEAAFLLIARHDSEGTFRFTIPGGEADGWDYEVSVQRGIATGAGS